MLLNYNRIEAPSFIAIPFFALVSICKMIEIYDLLNKLEDRRELGNATRQSIAKISASSCDSRQSLVLDFECVNKDCGFF